MLKLTIMTDGSNLNLASFACIMTSIDKQNGPLKEKTIE